MGSSVAAKCACGYAAEVSTGCGIEGPVPEYFPALCRHCGAMVSADQTSWPTVCSKCGGEAEFYDSTRLQQTKGRRTVLDERTVTDPPIRHRHNDAPYLCPKCGAFELRFAFGGRLWD